MIEEIWKPVRGFEGVYEIGNLGSVKSIGRIGGKNGRLLKQWEGVKYKRVNLCISCNNCNLSKGIKTIEEFIIWYEVYNGYRFNISFSATNPKSSKKLRRSGTWATMSSSQPFFLIHFSKSSSVYIPPVQFLEIPQVSRESADHVERRFLEPQTLS